MSSAWKKTNNELEKEFRDAEDELYNATMLVLYKYYGWRKLRIERFLNKASEVYDECGSSNKVSLVQMCDLELGIEVRNNKNETYKDTPYLNNDKWEIEKKECFQQNEPSTETMLHDQSKAEDERLDVSANASINILGPS